MYISQKLRLAKYLGRCNFLPPSAPKFSAAVNSLGGNIVLWGIVLMLHATATSFSSFFALRFLLGALAFFHISLSPSRLSRLVVGMFESCVAPLLILVISMFYKKDEQASVISSHRTE